MAGDGSDVTQLDALVAVMCVFCVLHARSAAEDGLGGGWRLLLASALVGLITEFGAIRFGGTHCHHGSAYANFAVCSSANSVLYYMPWIYSCVVSAVRLTGCDGEGGARWALPWITGALTFGMCGVYEMQGPLMQWWEWPAVDTRLAADEAHPRGHDWAPIWRFEHDGYGEGDMRPGGPLLMAPHAAEALAERLWGFPVMAPFFDLFFGWGIGAALYLAPGAGTLPKVVVGPFLALIWDPPVRLLEHTIGAPKSGSVPLIMALAIVVPLLLLPGGVRRRQASSEPDWLLFGMPLANHLFFVGHALTCGDGPHSPTNLKVLVYGISAVSLLAHAISAG